MIFMIKLNTLDCKDTLYKYLKLTQSNDTIISLSLLFKAIVLEKKAVSWVTEVKQQLYYYCNLAPDLK